MESPIGSTSMDQWLDVLPCSPDGRWPPSFLDIITSTCVPGPFFLAFHYVEDCYWLFSSHPSQDPPDMILSSTFVFVMVRITTLLVWMRTAPHVRPTSPTLWVSIRAHVNVWDCKCLTTFLGRALAPTPTIASAFPVRRTYNLRFFFGVLMTVLFYQGSILTYPNGSQRPQDRPSAYCECDNPALYVYGTGCVACPTGSSDALISALSDAFWALISDLYYFKSTGAVFTVDPDTYAESCVCNDPTLYVFGATCVGCPSGSSVSVVLSPPLLTARQLGKTWGSPYCDFFFWIVCWI